MSKNESCSYLLIPTLKACIDGDSCTELGAARREAAPNSFMHNPAILIEAKNLSNLEFLDLMNASFEILPPCGRQNDKFASVIVYCLDTAHTVGLLRPFDEAACLFTERAFEGLRPVGFVGIKAFEPGLNARIASGEKVDELLMAFDQEAGFFAGWIETILRGGFDFRDQLGPSLFTLRAQLRLAGGEHRLLFGCKVLQHPRFVLFHLNHLDDVLQGIPVSSAGLSEELLRPFNRP